MRAEQSARSERTRDELLSAALVRFLDQGVKSTSVDEIAADAGVTKRTFYRYFPSKEHILFSDYDARLDWFRAALRVRPRQEAITTSVRTAVESFPYDDALHQIAELRSREMEVEHIDAHLRRVQAEFAAEIELHLRRRLDESSAGHPDDVMRAKLHAHMIAGAMFVALETWLTGSDHGLPELERLIELALQTITAGVGDT
jgi:AcrR family transcriptional regulator